MEKLLQTLESRRFRSSRDAGVPRCGNPHDLGAERGFREGRAADIAKTDEQQQAPMVGA
jgi:hypothetical protein